MQVGVGPGWVVVGWGFGLAVVMVVVVVVVVLIVVVAEHGQRVYVLVEGSKGGGELW